MLYCPEQNQHSEFLYCNFVGDKKEESSSSEELSEERRSDSTTSLVDMEETQPALPTEQTTKTAIARRPSVAAKSAPKSNQLQPKSSPQKQSQSAPNQPAAKNKILSRRKQSNAKKSIVKTNVSATKIKKLARKSSNDGKSPVGKKDHTSSQTKCLDGEKKSGEMGGENKRKGSLWGALAMRQAKSRQSTTPDSGFQSDSQSFTSLVPDTKSQG